VLSIEVPSSMSGFKIRSKWFRNNGFQGMSRPQRAPRARLALEALTERVLPAITASFTAADGTLRVAGDDLDNAIVISRDAAGTILVNHGAVVILGGPATVASTTLILFNGGPGNDVLTLDEATGALPLARLDGGIGDDVLTGGSVGDIFVGAGGNDTVVGGAGEDTFIWGPGDGSDVVEGQGGRDVLTFGGSGVAEKFELSANGTRARFTRDVGGVVIDLNGVEQIDLSGLGGADTVTVNDQSATGLNTFNVDLSSTPGTLDNETDAVIINGTNGNDVGQIRSIGARINATVSAIPFVNITGEGGLDTLTVNTLGGNDVLDASDLAATNASQLVKLTVIGGTGNDTLTGSQGADTFVWNPGDGSDTINGGDNPDTLIVNGSDQPEKFDLSANVGRVRLTRDVGGVTMDVGGVETFTVATLGGADTVTVNDLTGTGVVQINVDLAASAGDTAGDGQADSVIVNGRNVADRIPILGAFVGVGTGAVLVNGGFADGSGLPFFLSVRATEGGLDSLTVNALGGNDTVDASGLPAGVIGLTVNLGGDQPAAPRVSRILVNGGAAQRSRVTQVRVAFDEHVTLPANPADAFRLVRQGDGAAVQVAAGVDDSGSGTAVTLTFVGGAVEGASLADGRYTLTVLAAQVSTVNGVLDGDGDGQAGGDMVEAGDPATNKLFRLFGDANGDGAVNGLDLAAFRAAFGTIASDAAYVSFLDANGDGAINGLDLAQFRTRFGTTA